MFVCLRACMCDLRKGRKSNWGAGFDCGTSIVDPCILLLNSHSSYTHTHTQTHTRAHTNPRLIDQIDLHMSDGANFSPFPPLANLWPLIYTGLNLYTLIMLLCSLALSLLTHTLTLTLAHTSFVWFTMQCTDTCSCCLSTSGEKKVQEHVEGLRKCAML